MTVGAIRDSFETSLDAAIELDVIEPDKHAAIIAAARLTADALDAAEEPRASMLGTYLNYCKALGISPTQASQQAQVVGSGKVARMRAHSRASLRAV